ncbi:MAG: hypothetical protein QXZ10_03725 [Sulfolobales archaeon]
MMKFKTISIFLIILSLTSGFLIGYYLTLQKLVKELSDVSVDIYALVNNVSNDIVVIRELYFRERPNVIIINSSVVVGTWGSKVPEDVLMLEKIFKKTLLVPESYNISESYSGLLGMWIAASVGNSIYVVSDNIRVGDPLVCRVLAHELMHVLQYQHFIIPMPKTFDETLAIRSFIEGDADVVSDSYVAGKGLRGISKVTDITFGDPFIDLQLLPYVFGSKFVEELYGKGGWGRVNEAYSSPPKSMKHIMFPEKYLSNETIHYIVNNVSCNVIYEDVLGPSYIYVMIGKYFNKSYALVLSESWLGDKATYCSGVDGDVLYWRIKWDSTNSAMRFYDSYMTIINMYGGHRVGDRFFVDGLIINVSQDLDEVVIESFRSGY